MTQAVFHQHSSRPLFRGEVPTASLTFGLFPLPTPQARRYPRHKAPAPASSAWAPLWALQSLGGSRDPGATDPNRSLRAAARCLQKRNRAPSCPDGSSRGGTSPESDPGAPRPGFVCGAGRIGSGCVCGGGGGAPRTARGAPAAPRCRAALPHLPAAPAGSG